MDFVGKRLWFFLFSALLLVPGIIFLIIAPGLRLGIDFTGGSTLQIDFGAPVAQNELRQELTAMGHTDSVVQRFGDQVYFIRTRELDDAGRDTLVQSLEQRFSPGGEGAQVLAFDLVSPVVARETVVNAFYAVLAAAVGIFFYIWWAFRSVPNPFRYGGAAIIALLHDTLFVVGLFALLGYLFQVEISTLFLIGLLTVIGYSVNDTIVVFDRLRENILNHPNRSLAEIANFSISETLGRSINTSVTLVITILALMLFGGPTIQVFLWVLLAGVLVGTYSSIGLATPLLVFWEEGGFRKLLGRERGVRPAATPAG